MDDLKTRIWDYLYRLGGSQQLVIIAERMNETPDAVQQAVDCPWFDQQDDVVTIAR